MKVDTRLVIEQLAERLDITPVQARRLLAMQEAYSGRPHLTTVLRPEVPTDALIMRGLGWKFQEEKGR